MAHSGRMTDTSERLARPGAIHHVRLTVTDIDRSRDFYVRLLGTAPAVDFSDQAGDPAVLEDPLRIYGGCIFSLGDQLLGLRPAAEAGDRFRSTRVGLDHLSLAVGSTEDLQAIAARLDSAGVEHGEITDLAGFGIAILSVQDPDDINLELTAPLPG
ncbi:MAG: putative glyoxylase family protein [Blastococcus sp.]|jgi:glyoxylase I family protein|nr:putative glyoxylase family protein [Blastococcus sp.]